jgi:hypothetical protein
MSYHQQIINVVALNSLFSLSLGNSHCIHVINICIEEVKMLTASFMCERKTERSLLYKDVNRCDYVASEVDD